MPGILVFSSCCSSCFRDFKSDRERGYRSRSEVIADNGISVSEGLSRIRHLPGEQGFNSLNQVGQCLLPILIIISEMEIQLGLWVFLACLVYGLAHSLLASRASKDRAQRLFGISARRYYRLGYNLVAIITFLPVLALEAVLPGGRIYAIPLPWLLITLAIQGLASVFLGLGILQTEALSFLGLRQPFLSGDELNNAENGPLVTGGLYRWVRHPLYSAGLVFIWLTPIMTWTGLGLIFGLTVYILAGAYFEERKLLTQYGAEYAAYRARTPMFIPGLRSPQR